MTARMTPADPLADVYAEIGWGGEAQTAARAVYAAATLVLRARAELAAALRELNHRSELLDTLHDDLTAACGRLHGDS